MKPREFVQGDATFRPGFRLSRLDVVVLFVGIMLSTGLSLLAPWLSFVVPFVLGHFFLFCNVFRLSRPLELAWAAIFGALAAATILADTPGWPLVACLSLAATVVVVGLEMRKPSYHGVLWQRINPGLRQWWEANTRDCGNSMML